MDSRLIDFLEDLALSDDWICVDVKKDHLDNSFTLYEKLSDTEFSIIKCTGIIQTSAKNLFDKILDPDLESRQEWDTQIQKNDVIEKIDDYTSLVHYVYYTPFPVKHRDFCVLKSIQQHHNKYIVCVKSTQNRKVPITETYVRGEIYISGYVIEDVGKDKAKITTITHVDPKGWIPGFLVSMTKNKQLLKLISLSKILTR